jgi:hypothetical protein
VLPGGSLEVASPNLAERLRQRRLDDPSELALMFHEMGCAGNTPRKGLAA